MSGMGSNRPQERLPGWRIHLFAARVLLGPARAGRRVRESPSELLQRKCRQFMAGEWEELWGAVRNRSLAACPPRDDVAVGRHASCLAKEGLYSKALQPWSRPLLLLPQMPLTLSCAASTLMV